MDRKIDSCLDSWKVSSNRKPLILLGARQAGKTTTVLAFGQRAFKQCVHVDFIKQPQLKAAFESSLEPTDILASLSALMRCDISASDALIFFDEIQECEQAISSLKYFATDAPHMTVCAAGSLLGVYLARNSGSFPVGYVDIRTLHPMDFEEFCWAVGDGRAFDLARSALHEKRACAAHDLLMDRYREYLMVGGMPEAVLAWSSNQSLAEVRTIQRLISTGYVADMSKHAENVDAGKIFACWDSMPGQLAKESGSTKFAWKEVAPGAKAATHRSALDWLASAGLIDIVTQVECIETPLKSFENTGRFKAYVADTGLLACAYDATPEDVLGKGPRTARFRGSIAENFVAQQLAAAGVGHYYWGVQSRAEVEFVAAIAGAALPIEVKSGENIRSASLRKAMEKYACPAAVRISGKNFGSENGIISLPLYAAGLTAEIE